MDWTADGTVCVLLSPPKDKLGSSSLTIQPALQTFSKGTTARIKLSVSSVGKWGYCLLQQRKKAVVSGFMMV